MASGEDELCCKMCRRQLDDALILQCHHDLCLECAKNQYLQSKSELRPDQPPALRCVLCGTWTTLEEQSVQILLDIRSERPDYGSSYATPARQAPSPMPMGGYQRGPSPAPQYSASLGYSGSGYGSSQQARRGNEFIAPSQEPCKDHPSEPVQFFSLVQFRLLCAECLLHGGHGQQLEQVLSLKNAHQRIREDIKSMLSAYSGRFKEIRDAEATLDERLKKLSSTKDQAMRETSMVFNEMRKALNEKEQEMMAKIEETVRATRDNLQREQQQVRNMRETLGQGEEKIKRYSQNEDAVDTLNWYSMNHRSFDDAAKEPVPLPPAELLYTQTSLEALRKEVEEHRAKLAHMGGLEFVNSSHDAMLKGRPPYAMHDQAFGQRGPGPNYSYLAGNQPGGAPFPN